LFKPLKEEREKRFFMSTLSTFQLGQKFAVKKSFQRKFLGGFGKWTKWT
jgi:hypothetical protein